MARTPRHDDEPPDRGAARPGRLQVPPGHAGGPPGPPDQLVLRPARRRPRPDGPAAGHLGGPQAAVDRLRGDRRRQDRLRRARPRSAGRGGELAAVEAARRRRRPTPTAESHASDACSPGGASSSGSPAGIAAYKAIEVCRRLVDAGAHVAPVMTEGAERFVGRDHLLGPGLRAGAHVAVRRRRPDPAHPARPGGRPRGGGPATARLLGAYAAGISDDLLTATLLATRAPVVVCPAMHTEMWEHPAVQDNLATLRRRGVHVVEPEVGPPGRRRRRRRPPGRARATSWPPSSRCSAPPDLAGLRVLVTAGGTREPIDAVRVITNRSSGKQGYALAAEAVARGRQGHARHHRRPAGARRRRASSPVETAAEMATAVLGPRRQADVIVMAAAVADFRPVAAGRRQDQEGRRAARDRARADPRHPRRPRARRKRPGQVLVGFAAETDDVVGQRPRQAAAQGPRPHRRQRRLGARRRLRARHQRGHHHRRPTAWCTNVPLTDKRAVAARRARRRRRRWSRPGSADRTHTTHRSTREPAGPSPRSR